MQIDTAGTYTLKYTAEDACGNITEVEREVVAEVISYRTVLYTDGTFIINEKSTDQAANEALHGVAIKEYIPFDPNASGLSGRYIFSDRDRPWYNERTSILSVEIGSSIAPSSMGDWFARCSNLVSVNLDGVDGSSLTNMKETFAYCSSLPSIDFSRLDTSNVTNMHSLFMSCHALSFVDMRCSSAALLDIGNAFSDACINSQAEIKFGDEFTLENATTLENMFYSHGVYDGTLDINKINPKNANTIRGMFGNSLLKTIFAAQSFTPKAGATTSGVFASCTRLVGGAGTRFSWDNPNDATYARIDNPPDAPGYFTAKA